MYVTVEILKIIYPVNRGERRIYLNPKHRFLAGNHQNLGTEIEKKIHVFQKSIAVNRAWANRWPLTRKTLIMNSASLVHCLRRKMLCSFKKVVLSKFWTVIGGMKTKCAIIEIKAINKSALLSWYCLYVVPWHSTRTVWVKKLSHVVTNSDSHWADQEFRLHI